MASTKALRLPPLPTIGEILRLYRLQAQKNLSQNFLLDLNLTNKIVRKAGKLNDSVVCEVGPGPGGITRSILNSGCRQVITIEKDSRFLPALETLNEASNGRVRTYQGDVLQFNMDHIFPRELAKPWDDFPPNIHIIGNLPFSVSTPLIIRWLEAMSNRTGAWSYGRVKLTLTFQKEVAERMTAPTNDRQRCRLSLMCQHLCHVKHMFTIPGKAFVPKPDVDVGVVQFVPLKEPLIKQPFKLVEKVVRQLFHYRQKPCRKGARDLFPAAQREDAMTMLHQAGVDPEARPFELTVKEFSKICSVYSAMCEHQQELFEYDYRSPEGLRDRYLYRKAKREGTLKLFKNDSFVFNRF